MEKRNAQKLALRGNSWYMVEYSGDVRQHLWSTPLGNLDPVIRLPEGNFLESLSQLDQESRNSHRLPRPRSLLRGRRVDDHHLQKQPQPGTLRGEPRRHPLGAAVPAGNDAAAGSLGGGLRLDRLHVVLEEQAEASAELTAFEDRDCEVAWCGNGGLTPCRLRVTLSEASHLADSEDASR